MGYVRMSGQHRKRSNSVFPLNRTCFVNIVTSRVDCDGYRHFVDCKLVDGFHTQILERHAPDIARGVP